MKKSLLLTTAMFAFAAAAQEATTPDFVAEELNGQTITLTCASGTGQPCNGWFLIVNGTSLAGAADHGSNPYKWLVEYDATEQGMILSAGGYYIGRVPNSADPKSTEKYFTLTQDKELAGRYRLYPFGDTTADGLKRYGLTATKFVNGTANENISKFGGGGDNTANHWMQCAATPTRWGSGASSSKWIYAVVEPDPVVEPEPEYTPEPGSYLTFKAAYSGFQETAFLFYNTDNGGRSAASKQNMNITYDSNGGTYNPASSIVYYDNDNLLSYTTGYYLGIKESAIRWLQESDLTETGGNEGAPIYIVRKTNVANILQMNSVINGSPVAVHADAADADRWYLNHTPYTGHENDAEYAKTGISTHNYAPWEVTTVNELPVVLGADGSGSFYAPVAVTFPEDVTVYAAEVTNSNITFSAVSFGTVIAPGTPVILTGTPDATVNATIDYDYQPSTEPAVLAETAAPTVSFYGKTAVEKLATTEGVCTFKPTAGDGSAVTLTKIESGSCLPVNTLLMSMPDDCPLISEDGTTVALKLNESNVTTGIKEIGADKANANGAIYDLQGRRLSAPVKGINIIGGRKVLVK